MAELLRHAPAVITLPEPDLLERLESALSSLQDAHTLVEAQSVRAAIHAIEKWTRVRNLSIETQRKANKVSLRADYQFGKFLEERNKRAGVSACSKTEQALTPVPSYVEQGIDRKDAMYCQQLAELGAEKLEEVVETAAAEGQRLTTARAVKLATKETRPEPPKAPPLPEGCFDLIYADPPWKTDFERGAGRDVEKHYATMSLEDIKKVKVPALAAKDCVLFLWATSPLLPEALEVLRAWGFTYKTSMVWVKSGIGQGYYSRIDHELLLIGTRGQPGVPEPANRPSSVVQAAKGRHSEKPEAFHETIEQMYPEKERLELFARKGERPGWTYWGNEVTDG